MRRELVHIPVTADGRAEGEGFQVTNVGGTPQLIVDVTGYFAGC